MTRARTLMWLVVVGILLTSCSLGTGEAKQGVSTFRTQVSQQAFSQIYQAAGPELRRAASEEQFVRFMTSVDHKLGPWQSSPEPGWNVTRTTAGHFVKLAYQSQFARGPAVEEFTWRIQNGQAVLLGYHVSSMLLVSD